MSSPIPGLRQGLKLAFVALLLYFLAQRGLLSWTATREALSQVDAIVPAVALFVFVQVAAMVRWKMLLSVQGLALPFATVFQLAMVGNFFNLALPGAVSVVKAWLAAFCFSGCFSTPLYVV